MHDPSQLTEIADGLTRLLAASPTEKNLLPVWHEESRSFAGRLGTEFSAVDLPEEIWHFLHDADTRARIPRFESHKQR